MTYQNINDVCETTCNHKKLATEIRAKLIDSEKLLRLSELFKVLGDHTRIRILHSLIHSELCVCDLSEILEMTQSAISHQLRVLRTSKVVKYRKEGKNVYYSLDDNHIVSLLNDGMAHVNE